jgi:hypothetical protein
MYLRKPTFFSQTCLRKPLINWGINIIKPRFKKKKKQEKGGKKQ